MEVKCPLIGSDCWNGMGNCKFWNEENESCTLESHLTSGSSTINEYELNASTTTKIADENSNRLSLLVHNQGSSKIFVKTYAASVDNDKKGLRINGGDSEYIPREYIGEVSAIASLGTPTVTVIEI
jgi:hypothetical protein